LALSNNGSYGNYRRSPGYRLTIYEVGNVRSIKMVVGNAELMVIVTVGNIFKWYKVRAAAGNTAIE